MKKRLKKLLTIVMSAMMLVVFMPTSTFAAGTDNQQTGQPEQGVTTTPPAAEKTLVPNGDGTYKLSLSVTGKSETSSESSKADVVVIMDVSGSMSNTTTVYEKHATGRYGFIGGQYVQLYSYSESRDRYSSINNNSYEGNVYYKSGSNYIEYKDTRYASATKSRLAVAKQSVGDLAQQLLANNDGTNTDKVKLSLISFSNVAKTEVENTTDIDSFKNKVDNLSAEGGTNWEDALKKAASIQARTDAAKYVIFVSDGNPTFRNTEGTYNNHDNDYNEKYYDEYKVWGTGSEDNSTTVTRCYDHAKDDAKALVDAGWQFYGIGVFGNVDRMKSLVNYAYYGDNAGTASDKYFSATDQAQLAAAFQNIINSITQNFGYSNVVINDGLTGLVSCDIGGEAGGFTYTKNGEAWADAPKATLTDKQVKWDLGNTQLENGVTYTVSFNVWPSQRAYDLVADLNNGVKTDNDPTDDERAQIVPMSGGGYGLNTNTAAGVKYTQIETKTTTTEPEGYKPGEPAADGYVYEYNETTKLYTGTKATNDEAPIDNPDPIPVVSYNMEVEKDWEGGEGSAVTLELLKDGEPTGVTVELNKDNNWRGSVFLAPGLVVGEDTKEILDDGHNYSLRETSGGTEYYSFSSNTQHPMLVNSATNVVKNLTNPDDISLDDIGTLVGTNTLIPPSAVSKELKILKKVTGKDAIENFAFELSLDGESGDTEGVTDAEGNAITTLIAQSSSTTKIAAGGQEYVSFGNVKFSKEGTYVFKVRETTTTTAGGWTYDSTTKEIEVKVEKASDKNELVIASISATPEFTNSYSAKAATISIPVKKSLTGTGANTFDISNAFTFTLAAVDNAPLPETTTITNPDSDGGTATFGPIRYTSEGTYTYTVTESGSVDGIVNDANSEKTVTVRVVDNGNGQLVASIASGNDITEDGALKFTNKVIEPKDVQLQVTKKVQGKDATVPFTFSIELAKGNRAGVVMPQNNEVTTTDSIEAGAQETVSFDSIRFTKAGTYTFDVKEVYTDTDVPAGWTYDSATKQISVTVEKDSVKDELTVTSISDTPVFTNLYKASPVTDFQIPVTKVLDVSDGSDTDAPDITKKYTFTLTGKDGAPMPTVTQKTNPDSDGGTVTFGPIKYVSVGTYEYTVTETGSVAHITNDSNATKTITVNVVDNNQGQLVASIKDSNGVTFKNTYAPESTTANISVKKNLVGTGAPDISGKYKFKLEAVGNAPMPANNTELTNPSAGGGTVTFGDIIYTEAGTYEYKVKESGSVDGIVNDANSEKTVTVVVKDNNGKLSAVVNSGETLTFTNTYAPTPASAELEVTKVLENMKLKENQFTFQVLDNNGKAVRTQQNAADGTVAFEPLSYNYPGVYNYTIKEVIPDDADKVKGVTYDNHDVKVKVTVTDTDGKLSAAVEYEGDKTTFTNTYNASGKSAIVGLKTLEGKTLEAGKYTFKLEGENGAPMPAKTEVTNDANGYVNFGEINFKLSDLDTADEDKSDEDGSEGKTEGDSTVEGGSQETAAAAASEVEGADDVNSDENKEEDAVVPRTKTFTYTVTEVAGNETGITYDTTPQEFTITVTDDKNGGLTVTTNPPTGEQNAPLFTIKNVYTPATATIDVTKAFIDGRTELNAWDEEKYANEEFEFELKAVGNAPLKPVDSSAASKTVTTSATSPYASFGMYVFDEAGTYEYTITEKNAGSGDVEYDTAEHKVTVVVTEDETTHKLSADVKYDETKESLTVINTLKPADNAKLNVVKHVVNTNGQPLSVNGKFHVALFSDKALTHRVSAVKNLEFNGSDPTANVEFAVTPGRTYYVAETDADGKALGGAQKFDDQLYYICFGDPSGIEDFTDYPQYGEAAIPDSGSAEDVVFSNIFDGSKFMILGSITIDKEVKIGKETKAVDGSFYVTAEYSQGNSDTVEKQTVELKVKDGKTEQPVTISNLPTNTDITLKETDANGNALENSVYNPIFTYGNESGETLKVTLTEEASDIEVNLVNSEKLIDVAFDLKWDDYDNRDNTRDEYAVTLFANGVEVEDSTMTFGYDVTEGKWTDLRQYDDDGNEIVYSVKQTVVPENYSSNTDGTEFGLAPDEDGIVHLIDVYRAVTITKKVTDSTGKAIKYNGDFYVTMFADPEGKEIAMDPVKITLDNEKSKTVIIPVPANTLYYLAETDEDGNKVDSSFEFIPTFSSTIAEVTDDEVSIVLTNEAKAGTPADDSDTKTGDSANLMLMLLALLTSMLIGIVIILRSRRREC